MKLRITILLVAIILFGGTFWVWYHDGLKPVSALNTNPSPFIIEKGSSIRDIADQLERDGFIRSKLAFFLYIRMQGLAQTIQAGEYTISPSMDATTIVKTFTRGSNDVRITTIEGWRVDEIATKLAKELAIPEQEFLKYAKEGYMFPDTYMIPKTASAAAIAQTFDSTFNRKMTATMIQDAKKNDLTPFQVVTIASIVEREGNGNEDRPVIAGILIKRYKADWPLQADATLQYALGYQTMDKTWWKKSLTEEDKLIDSPYNTYKYPGLPPGPISNPGLAAISSVIYSKETPYWYYLHAPDGHVYYAQTIEEHEENIRKYLQ